MSLVSFTLACSTTFPFHQRAPPFIYWEADSSAFDVVHAMVAKWLRLTTKLRLLGIKTTSGYTCDITDQSGNSLRFSILLLEEIVYVLL